ncbi:MAG: hypothetical protein E6G67_04650 [Actinobacteria bacterium]|nr:MAG: hypothetical protein E6G67_04650 [Actinomycetota bacterium]
MSVLRRPGFAAFSLATGAIVWALGLFAALLVWAHNAGEMDPGDTGWWIAVPIGIPVLLAVLGWVSLRLLCTGRSYAEKLAIGVLVLLGAFSIVSAASIGLLVLPVVLLLIGAFQLTPRPADQ